MVKFPSLLTTAIRLANATDLQPDWSEKESFAMRAASGSVSVPIA